MLLEKKKRENFSTARRGGGGIPSLSPVNGKKKKLS